jgi:hypothetical protein
VARRDLLVVVLLVAAVAVVYGRVAGFGFVDFDDPAYVFANPHVREGLSWRGIGWAFTTHQEANWTPLAWISHMAAAQAFGVERAAGHHLVNVALHAANAALLYVLLRVATGSAGRSACVAALFALHPLNVESVAWVSARKDVLAAFFGLGSLIAYVDFARSQRAGSYAFACALLALGLLSKSMLVTWPLVMLLLDFWPLGRGFGKKTLLEKVPFAALAIGACVATILAHRVTLANAPTAPLGLRLQNVVVQYAIYVLDAFWPSDLAVLYPYPGRIAVGVTLAAAAFLALVTIGAARAIRRFPPLSFGWFWFLGTLVPVIGFVQVALHARADRYAYLPTVGLFVAVVWGASAAGARARAITKPAFAAVLVACAIASTLQLSYWRDTVALFRHTCAVTRDNGWAHRILGTALAGEHRPKEAIPEYQEALRVWPEDPIARNNLGCAFEADHRIADAVREYRQAVRLDPRNATYQRNLDAALAKAESTSVERSRGLR